jgi:hypothetical protein
MFSISSSSIATQQQYNTTRISFVVAYWSRTHVIMGSNPRQVLLSFFHAATMLLFYIIQWIAMPKFCIFQKSITVHHCMAIARGASVAPSSQVRSSAMLVLPILGN